MEVPGSSSGNLFYPVVTALLDYLDPQFYTCLVFAL